MEAVLVLPSFLRFTFFGIGSLPWRAHSQKNTQKRHSQASKIIWKILLLPLPFRLPRRAVVNSRANAGDAAQSPGQEDALEKERAAHSSIFAWRTPGQRSLAGCSRWGPKELDATEATQHALMQKIQNFIDVTLEDFTHGTLESSYVQEVEQFEYQNHDSRRVYDCTGQVQCEGKCASSHDNSVSTHFVDESPPSPPCWFQELNLTELLALTCSL